MIDRPPIQMICYNDSRGNPVELRVGYPFEFKGTQNITEIREVEDDSEVCFIPWAEVWAGERLVARFNQHKLEHIFY